MRSYLDLMRHIRENGTPKEDRTGTGTLSVFGAQLRFDLSAGFPLLTTKKVHLKSIIHELLWFLKGSTNIEYLTQNGVTIWDEWADKNGDLGPVYGHQWRSWPTKDGGHIDQISKVIDDLKKKPGFSPTHCLCLECIGHRQNGACTVPHVFSVLCCWRQTIVPALPAQC